jgi:putative cell wall-binding protein
MINRERNIALDEEQSKIIISKKSSRDLETKYSFDIINLKEDSEERLRELDLYLSDYDRKYDIQVAALESNSMSMRKYYDDAITFETKNRLVKLADLYRQRKESKLNYENNLARLNTNYEIEKEKNTNQAKNRINNVIKQYMQKSMDYDMQLKGLDELLKKSSIECNNAIIDSDLQLTDFIKKLDNSKQNDIKKVKDEIGKKLKHDIKKYKLELENKNGTTS